MDAVEQMIERVIKREGGYVNHSADRGGPTKYGITIATLRKFRGSASVEDVQNLSVEEAKTIYREMFWAGPGYDQLGFEDKPLVTELLFDTTVHSGQRNAVKMLQRALSVTDDGFIGPITAHAAARDNDRLLATRLLAERYSFIARLVQMDRTQTVFLTGWINRLREFLIDIGLSHP